MGGKSSISIRKGNIREKHAVSLFMNLCLAGRNRHSLLKMEEKIPGPIGNQ